MDARATAWEALESFQAAGCNQRINTQALRTPPRPADSMASERRAYDTVCAGEAIKGSRPVREFSFNLQISWRLSDEPITDDTLEEHLDPEMRRNTRCKIFLGYTSNLVSAGTREQLRYLAQHKMVDVIVSSAGGIEEDFIKVSASFKGRELCT